MSIYTEMRERIMQIKKERNLWKKRYKEQEELFAGSCEKALNQLTEMQSEFSVFRSAMEFLTKKVSEHSRLIDDIKEKTGLMNIDIKHTNNRVQSLKTEVSELKKLSELQIDDMRKLSDDMRNELVSLKSEKHELEAMKNELRSLVTQSIREHEKVFDKAMKEKIQSLEKAFREFERESIRKSEEAEKLKKSLSEQEENADELRHEMKKFKEYVISYINDLLQTYEKRFSLLKRDIEDALERARK